MVKNRFAQILLIIAGFLSIAIAILGIFLPLIPTTPLVLLAGYLFGKSSKKFHLWLINNKIFGKYIKNYQAGNGMTRRSKITAITTMWAVLLISGIWATNVLFIRLILATVGIGVTIHLLRMPTYIEDKLKIELNEE
jgi:uncharacterized membrane protein YbaN (DUF454 family)